jgi:hypothetical protein
VGVGAWAWQPYAEVLVYDGRAPDPANGRVAASRLRGQIDADVCLLMMVNRSRLGRSLVDLLRRANRGKTQTTIVALALL